MNRYLRNMLALVAAVWLAIPTPGNGGGENNGNSGVWILPACAGMTQPSTAPRAEHTVADTSGDIKMRVDNSMGAVAATFTDDLSGTTVGVQVSGRLVTVPKQLLQALEQSAVSKGTLLISDASSCGYFIRVTVKSDGSVNLKVY